MVEKTLFEVQNFKKENIHKEGVKAHSSSFVRGKLIII